MRSEGPKLLMTYYTTCALVNIMITAGIHLDIASLGHGLYLDMAPLGHGLYATSWPWFISGYT